MAPAPPSTMSKPSVSPVALAFQVIVSLPVPAAMMSLPVPPVMVSSPSPALMLSLPPPPVIALTAALPTMMSLAARAGDDWPCVTRLISHRSRCRSADAVAAGVGEGAAGSRIVSEGDDACSRASARCKTAGTSHRRDRDGLNPRVRIVGEQEPPARRRTRCSRPRW